MFGIELDRRQRLVTRDGTAVKLGPIQFSIVCMLLGAPDGMDREAVIERAYFDRDDPPWDDTFNVAMSQLRKKLRAMGLGITKANRWDKILRLYSLGD